MMVRQPAVAGTFYPANAGILRQTVEQLLKASVTSFETERPKCLNLNSRDLEFMDAH
jgi:AmmeMemoRadiSam system protein B